MVLGNLIILLFFSAFMNGPSKVMHWQRKVHASWSFVYIARGARVSDSTSCGIKIGVSKKWVFCGQDPIVLLKEML